MKAFLCLLALSFSASVHAQGTPSAPSIAAKSYVLYDFQSRQSLAAHNPDERVEPASLTKLMTAYLAFSALKQNTLKRDQVVPVSQAAWKAEGSRTFIDPRTPVTVDELLHGMIVQSGNDASIALAEAIAGSEESFARLMNKEAKRLGLNDTNFVNSTGLPHPQHYSTASDLAKLAAALVRDHGEYYPLYSLKDYTYNKIKQPNRNRLLWTDPTVDGMKTGHTKNAGWCLVSSAKRGERRLVSVLLGADSSSARAAESQKLLNFGFQFFDTVRLYEKGQSVASLKVWKGATDTLNAGFTQDLYFSLPKGQAEKLKATLESQQPLVAPVAIGQRVGTMKIALDGKPLTEVPVVAIEKVELGNIFARGWDAMRLFFK
ncbi:MAG: D-alanyl-D-alanine carboxypeptidase [Burkholderiales bacterium]|nr:D-alanyl-D-alanine carboxypeptidase [Burkholderiales bacterium]